MFTGTGSRLYLSTNLSHYASCLKTHTSVPRLSISHPSRMSFSESLCSSRALNGHRALIEMRQESGFRLRIVESSRSIGGARLWVFEESVVRSWATTRCSGFWNGAEWKSFLNEDLMWPHQLVTATVYIRTRNVLCLLAAATEPEHDQEPLGVDISSALKHPRVCSEDLNAFLIACSSFYFCFFFFRFRLSLFYCMTRRATCPPLRRARTCKPVFIVVCSCHPYITCSFTSITSNRLRLFRNAYKHASKFQTYEPS